MDTKLSQLLASHFDSVYEGPNGDYPAVLEALEGISAAKAAWTPAAGSNSIWQITDHLTAANLWQLEVLEKGQAAAPVWTEPPGGEEAWQASLARLATSHEKLKAALLALSDEELLAMPDPKWKKTSLELLLSSAAHEACHAGQIDYLKGLAAVPPA